MCLSRVLWSGCCFLLAGVICWADTAPVAVSPGTPAGALIADACPTFTWGAVAGAQSYELMVYRLNGEEPEIALSERIPGSALAWTPSLDRCLERGRPYAWSVRALGGDESSEWSQPSFFEVTAAPTAEEVAQAMSVLSRFLEAVGEASTSAEPLSSVPATATDDAAAVTRASPGSASLATAAAAIRAELADTTGEVYGVAGISHSAQGAGLIGQNTAGGADLVLSGDALSPDARLSESGLESSADSDIVYSFGNPGAGSMTVATPRLQVAESLHLGDPAGGWTMSDVGGEIYFDDHDGGGISMEVGGYLSLTGEVRASGAQFTEHVQAGAIEAVNVIASDELSADRIYAGSVRADEVAIEQRLGLGLGSSPALASLDVLGPSGTLKLLVRKGTPGGSQSTVLEVGDNVFVTELEVDDVMSVSGPASLSDVTAEGFTCPGCVDESDLGFDPGTQAELSAHAGDAEAHREHATLEESAEIDSDIATHVAISDVHHSPPSSLPPSGPAGGDLAGTYPNPSVVSSMARDSEVATAVSSHAGSADAHREHASLDDPAFQRQVFTADGTWVRPDGVDLVWVTMIGGGGQGGGNLGIISFSVGAGGGGAGQAYTRYPVDVSSNVAVTVGQGGSGCDDATGDGADGTASSFGSLVAVGGSGGKTNGTGGDGGGAFCAGGAPGTSTVQDGVSGGTLSDGAGSCAAGGGGGHTSTGRGGDGGGMAGGSGGLARNTHAGGGGGGAVLSFGTGGAGGDWHVARSNCCVSGGGGYGLGADGTGYGAGGGGSKQSNCAYCRACGSSGAVIIEWFE